MYASRKHAETMIVSINVLTSFSRQIQRTNYEYKSACSESIAIATNANDLFRTKNIRYHSLKVVLYSTSFNKFVGWHVMMFFHCFENDDGRDGIKLGLILFEA